MTDCVRLACTPHLSPGERVYAIGDVHGRADLLAELLAAVRRDNDARQVRQVRIVLLGDLIDRGGESADVVAQCCALSRRHDRFVVLKGNHEAMMVDALQGSFPALAFWLKQGGDAALASWGVPAGIAGGDASLELMAAARSCVPPETVAWLAGLPLTHEQGNCLFVHAGIRPGIALAKQDEKDLLWIRGDFTDDAGPLPYVVIHGHTIEETGPLLHDGRLGIDTGAYRTGRLTAVGLEGEAYWSLSTGTHPVGDRTVPQIAESVEALLTDHGEDDTAPQRATNPMPVLATASTVALALLVVGAVAAVRTGSGSPAPVSAPMPLSVRAPAPATSLAPAPVPVPIAIGLPPPEKTRQEAGPALASRASGVLTPGRRIAARRQIAATGAGTSPAVDRVSPQRKDVGTPKLVRSTVHRLEPSPSPVAEVAVVRAPVAPPIAAGRVMIAPVARPAETASQKVSAVQPWTPEAMREVPASVASTTPPPAQPAETRKERAKAIDAIRLLRRQ